MIEIKGIEKNTINTLVKELKKITEVKAIYLFGSYARGNPKPYSDIDISVVTDKNISLKKRNYLLSFSSKIIDLSLFYNLPLYVQHRVVNEGKLLFSRDLLLTHRLKITTTLHYLDFKHVLNHHFHKILVS